MTRPTDTIADTIKRQQTVIEDQQERIEELEATVADWAPFINQVRITLAQLSQNPMVAAMVPPASREMLAAYLPPKD